MRKKRNVRRALRRQRLQPPLRGGVNAARVVLPDGSWQTLGQWAFFRFGESVWQAFAHGDFLADENQVLTPDTPYEAGKRIWIFRPILDEPTQPFQLGVVAETDRYLVVDKPHGMASIPRGSHVANSVTVAARRQFANDNLACAHRLDLETAGLVLLTKAPEYRKAYQMLFQRRQIQKTYLAVAAKNLNIAGSEPVTWELPLWRPDNQLQVEVVSKQNEESSLSVTQIRFLHDLPDGLGLWELKPHTGYTHQLRVVMNHLGSPIIGDPLYPQLLTKEAENQRPYPLQLLANKLEFTDPYTGEATVLVSRQNLALVEVS